MVPRIPFKNILLFIFMTLSFISCEEYKFSMPQPVDKENINVFPKQLLGAWIDQDSTITVVINKKDVSKIEMHDVKVVKGAWPKLDKKGAYIFTPYLYREMETIHYDSLKNPIDTVASYLLRGDRIYEITTDGFLNKGFPYRQDKDTLLISVTDTLNIDLGKNAFLRQLNKNIYAFNFLQNSLDENTNWWVVTIIELKDEKTINLWDLTGKVKMLPCMFYRNKRSNYLDCELTAAKIIDLMNDSTFEVTVPLYKIKPISN
jgi:hypothetical protein